MTVKQVAALIAFIFLATAAFAQTNRDGDRTEGQVRFGFDAQDYNTSRTSQVGSIDATVRILPRLTLEAVATGGVYFGAGFGGGAAYVTVKPDAKTYLTVGGSQNSDTSTTVSWSGTLEAGRAVYQSDLGVIRGLETDFNLTKRGYHFSPYTNVLLVNPAVVVYLPRDWALTLRAGAIRTTVAGTSMWTPSGGAKLNIPLTRRLSVSPGIAFDSEVSDVLQLRNISSREFGGGALFWLTRRTSVGAYYFRVLYGANRLANDSYGVSYALRF
jgi:hypothetical protein